jgi:hypothetical protein
MGNENCNINSLQKVNCSDSIGTCNGCKKAYCSYHLIGTKCYRPVGGHTSGSGCSTSVAFVQNCEGSIYTCDGCHDSYCSYHLEAVGNALKDLVGGHVCPVKSKNGKEVMGAYKVAKVVTVVTGAAGAAVFTGGSSLAALGTVGMVGGLGNYCSTSQVTKLMCSGAYKSCPHCKDTYCEYHHHCVDDILVPTGGHVCPIMTQGATIGAVIEGGIDIAVAAETLGTAGESLLGVNIGKIGKIGIQANAAKTGVVSLGKVAGKVQSSSQV